MHQRRGSADCMIRLEIKMDQYIIKGGKALAGEISVSGAKNAALGILAAAVMADETVTVENLRISGSIDILLNAIASVGAVVERIDKHCVRINGGTVNTIIVANDNIRKIRGSYYLLGALLGKYKSAHVLLPGDAISEAGRSTSISRDSVRWEPT